MSRNLSTAEWLKPSEVGRVLGMTRRQVIIRIRDGQFETARLTPTDRWEVHRDEVIRILNGKAKP